MEGIGKCGGLAGELLGCASKMLSIVASDQGTTLENRRVGFSTIFDRSGLRLDELVSDSDLEAPAVVTEGPIGGRADGQVSQPPVLIDVEPVTARAWIRLDADLWTERQSAANVV